MARRLGITLLVLGLAFLIGGLVYWLYLVSYCGNAFSTQSTLNYCKSYFTVQQLTAGGLANSMPLLISLLLVPGLVFLTGGVALLVGSYIRRK